MGKLNDNNYLQKLFIDDVKAILGAKDAPKTDPAAEAVMALMKVSNISELRSDVGLGIGAFHLLDNANGYYREIGIIPPQIVRVWEGGLDFVGFQNMSSTLNIVLSLPTTPPEIEGGWINGWSHSGGGFTPVTIFVPDKSVDAYKAAAGWSEFADRFQPMSLTSKAFWVNGIFCIADEGMTWGQWMASEYYNAETNIHVNTEIMGEEIIVADDSCPLYDNTAYFQYPSSPIIMGMPYRNA